MPWPNRLVSTELVCSRKTGPPEMEVSRHTESRSDSCEGAVPPRKLARLLREADQDLASGRAPSIANWELARRRDTDGVSSTPPIRATGSPRIVTPTQSSVEDPVPVTCRGLRADSQVDERSLEPGDPFLCCCLDAALTGHGELVRARRRRRPGRRSVVGICRPQAAFSNRGNTGRRSGRLHRARALEV